MNSMQALLSEHAIGDARSALYYLSRYLKQASHFEKYGKDIFDDDARSYPSEAVRSTTAVLINFIEKTEKISVTQFDDATYVKWSNQVAEIESSLDPEASANEIERAAAFASAMTLPHVAKD